MRIALLGQPVRHSRSPAIFAAAFAATGLVGTYEARAVNADGVESAFAELASGTLHGLNVTMPHKALAYDLCDRVADAAGRAGAVNTVKEVGGSAVGYSTDIDAVTECWSNFPQDRPILILGGGGAAAAALVALADREPYIATRRFGAGAAAGARTRVEVGEVRWGVPVVGAVVVNCTPLGMRGESLPEAVLELGSGLLDMAYGAAPTPAVSLVRGLGHPVVDGLDLLVSQAAHGFRLFTGLAPPVEAMRAAAENH